MKKVLLYALNTCPWCRKAKQFFNDNKIEFAFVDYDMADEADKERIREEIKGSGMEMAFPWVRIGDGVVSGYNPGRYEELLGLKF